MTTRDEDIALSKLRRIPRLVELPRSVEHEDDLKAKYPLKLLIAGVPGGEIRVRRTRRFELGPFVHRRDLFAWLRLNGARVGALQFIEFDFEPFPSREEIFDDMDSYDSSDAQLGGVLCNLWEDPADFADYGPLVELRIAWMAKGANRPGLWVTAAEQVIATYLRDYSVLMLKAFPLEYEGRVPLGSRSAIGLNFRRKAMIRYYRRVLKMSPVPSRHGREGWMWRPNPLKADVIERPKHKPWRPNY